MHVDATSPRRTTPPIAGKPFFVGLVDFITSSPLVALALEGPNAIAVVRAINGATRPHEAAPGTIRGDFALETAQNIVHASDGPEAADDGARPVVRGGRAVRLRARRRHLGARAERIGLAARRSGPTASSATPTGSARRTDPRNRRSAAGPTLSLGPSVAGHSPRPPRERRTRRRARASDSVAMIRVTTSADAARLADQNVVAEPRSRHGRTACASGGRASPVPGPAQFRSHEPDRAAAARSRRAARTSARSTSPPSGPSKASDDDRWPSPRRRPARAARCSRRR